MKCRKPRPVIVLAALATAGEAAPPAEWAGQAALPNLVIGHRLSNGQSMIAERVPPGETIERWTRMVTNQRLAGELARRHAGRNGWAAIWAGSSRAAQAFGPALQPGCGSRVGLRSTSASIALRNPATGLPETFFVRAIGSGATLHLAQIAFRRVPSAEEARWALGHLASVTLCTSASRSPVCRAGPEAFDR